MNQYHIAQLNIASMKTAMEDPSMKDFVDNLEVVNRIADNSPGFIWRLQTEEGDATSITVFDDDMLLVNMSVWQDLDSLKKFVYESYHVDILKRKKEWFRRFDGAHQVLWWIREGTIPTLSEAETRLRYLQACGPSPLAFTFSQHFAADEKHLAL